MGEFSDRVALVSGGAAAVAGAGGQPRDWFIREATGKWEAS